MSATDTVHSNNEIELQMKASDNSMDGFREMPIDCLPFSYDTSTMNLMGGIQQSNDPTILTSKINDSTTSENLIMRKDSKIMKLLIVNDSNLDENDTSSNLDEIVLMNNNLYTKNNEKNNVSNTLMLINETDQSKQMNTNFNNNLKSFTNMINANNLQSLQNRRSTLYRNSSLSTISEEKTLATLTDVSLKNNKQLNNSYDASRSALTFKNYNAKKIIESLLDDFQEKSVLLNEMIKVFEPSSKHGNFSRNVPIRFSSPLKPNLRLSNINATSNTKSNVSLNQTPTSPSIKKLVSYSPIISVNNRHVYENDYNNDLFPVNSSNLILFDVNFNEYEDDVDETNRSSCSDFSKSSTSVNKLNQKKLRFVKRLKNRIETKSGRNLILQIKQGNQIQNNNDSNQNNNNDATLEKRLSLDIIDNDLNINQFTRENILETSSNNSLTILDTNTNDPFEQNNLVNNNDIIIKPNLIVNKNIEPVFF
jgi:hypothetical protein